MKWLWRMAGLLRCEKPLKRLGFLESRLVTQLKSGVNKRDCGLGVNKRERGWGAKGERGLLWGALAVSLCTQAFGAERSKAADAPLNVLILFAGDPFLPAVIVQMTALRETIASGTERPVNFHAETLDTTRIGPTAYDTEFALFINRKYQEQRVDIIIVGGMAGLNFLERNRARLWPETPAMFFSVDDQGIRGRKFAPGLSGLTMRFEPEGTLDLSLRLKPNAKRVVVVAGVSESDRFWLPRIQTYVQTHHLTQTASYLTNQTVAELAGELQKLPADSVVLYLSVIQDAAGKRFVPRDVLARLSKVSSAPIFALYETSLGYGAVGGVMPNLEEEGRRAGKLALRIIAGERPNFDSTLAAPRAVPIVDWRELRRWKMNANDLPAGSEVRFRPPSLWEEHKHYIIAGVCVTLGQTLTIAFLLAHWRRRNEAQSALRESEARFRAVADTAPVMIWMSGPNKQCNFFNKGWLYFTGRPLGNELGNGWAEGVHPEDLDRYRKSHLEAFEARRPFTIEYRLRRHDGEYRWISDTGVPRHDSGGNFLGYIGSCQDLTERRRADEKFRLAVEASLDGIVLVNREGRIVLANTEMRHLFGYKQEELLGHDMEMLIPERNRGMARGFRSKFFGAPTARVTSAERELFAVRKDGTEFPVEIGLSAMQTEEGILALVAVVDITARKETESEVQRQRAELMHVARVSTLGELAASIAHELAQPLGAILSNAEAAEIFINREPPALEEVRSVLADIREDDERAGEVIRRLRALLRRHELDQQPLGINSLVDDVLKLVKGDASLRNVTTSAELAPALPMIAGDRIYLQQVMLNLILNGMDAVSEQPPERRRLTVRTRRDANGGIELAIADWGHGIKPQERARLFEPFFTTKAKGMGMGLSISKTIIESHRGKIWVEDNADGGAVFKVWLPRGEKEPGFGDWDLGGKDSGLCDTEFKDKMQQKGKYAGELDSVRS
jgi:two-component system sensor kinase FixL